MTEDTDNGKKPPGKAWKTFKHVTGISDIQFIFTSFKQTISLTGERAKFIKAQTQKIKEANAIAVDRAAEMEEPFETVMARASESPEHLINITMRRKRYWLACLAVSAVGLVFLVTGMMRLAFSSADYEGWYRLVLTLLLLIAAGALSYVRAMHLEFLAWRMRNRCNSKAERGTYQDFVAAGGQKDTLNFMQAGQLRSDHEAN